MEEPAQGAVVALRSWSLMTIAYALLSLVLGAVAAFLAVVLGGVFAPVVGALLALLLWADTASVVAVMVRPGRIHVGAEALTIESPVLLTRPVVVRWEQLSSIRQSTKSRARGGQVESPHPTLAFLGPRRVLVLEFRGPLAVEGRRFVLPLWRHQFHMWVMGLPVVAGRERGLVMSLPAGASSDGIIAAHSVAGASR
ncbi:hypothetical protein [Janibacter sp. G368]|uniref:hypothetical protein n=1 Tax=Janibacter sp. G368 TaxID=3420441 RepID=UPI003D072EFB